VILRRITEHVKAQNWTAVALDFFIVVVGVFIGIQVANWNDARADNARERELLAELKIEISESMNDAQYLHKFHANVHAAAKRSIEFMDSGGDCGDACWPVLADFFHASQWQPVNVDRTTFDEMRRQGLPRSREIVALVEAYLSQNFITMIVLADPPAYREHVRGLIPAAVHEAYWTTCYDLMDGIETINFDDCPPAISNAEAAQAVQTIIRHPDTRPYLTFWFSEITPTASELDDQNAAAMRAIAAIDAELERRP